MCKNAASELGLPWQSTWNGPSDVPGCIFANDGRRLVYFNLALTATGANPKYAEICKGKIFNSGELYIFRIPIR